MTTNCEICALLINDLFTEGLLAAKVIRKHAAILHKTLKERNGCESCQAIWRDEISLDKAREHIKNLHDTLSTLTSIVG
jgi:hypothetical protein